MPLAMMDKRIWGLAAALAIAGLLAWAWIDGGREPVRPMVEEVALPGGPR